MGRARGARARDAVHTAHFAIGSGTKLAIEDAIELTRQFIDIGDAPELIPQVLARSGVRLLQSGQIHSRLEAGSRAFNLRVADPYLPYQKQGLGFTWSFFTPREEQEVHVHGLPWVAMAWWPISPATPVAPR